MNARLITSLAFLLAASPAFAAGGGGSSEPAPVPKCEGGKVWDKNRKKCVSKQSQLGNDSIYETGRSLAMQGRYGEAIEILSLAADKSDPRILNYLGYSHRKQGRVLVGLGYYEEALRVDPDYTLVREYMGEAHLQLGDVTAARKQLAEIEKRCGKGCAEYAELARQIDAHVKG
ncbi:hypothetical protein MesoLjLc_18720 [Mesorhizobium sp. L-8-10]|uniref:tetratricopeptide repeat protein n=1 Tax=unclassified Mesorhizobium TaxID=325217 RepID=UPI0019267BAA|nr:MULTISPECIES: tetratricopeptide repeat protein [unclassified Mesorhizobium]BCH22128.1 hypothetical protein MesoLjLb_19130 [Mesorhizobium sp. L-8-3]BCH29942.1 hypothetical protein MesoLjLc_18720 [Mesorhizobium sp. L-8-10]